MSHIKKPWLVAFAALVLPVALSAFAGEKEEKAKKNAVALAHALQEHMLSTYSCQTYLGGLGHYRAAKFLAVNTYSGAIRDRNKAVLTMDRIEREIKATNANERLVVQFDKMKLSYIDRVGTCQDLTAESMDKVELLQAKLGLL